MAGRFSGISSKSIGEKKEVRRHKNENARGQRISFGERLPSIEKQKEKQTPNIRNCMYTSFATQNCSQQKLYRYRYITHIRHTLNTTAQPQPLPTTHAHPYLYI